MRRTLLGFAALAAVAGSARAGEPAPPAVRKASDVAAVSIANGKGTARLLLDGAGVPVAFDELTAQAGMTIPPHRHDASDEILYVLEGRGTTLIGGKAYKIEAGDVIHIARGIEHSLTVEAPLKALQVYAPGGPEQRFKPQPKAAR